MVPWSVEQLEGERQLVYRPRPDSPGGEYDLFFPTGTGSPIRVPVYLSAQGQEFTASPDSGELRYRFPTLADVTVAGQGFNARRCWPHWPVSASLLLNTKCQPWAPGRLRTDDKGEFRSTIPDDRLPQLTFPGYFVIVLCGDASCELAPSAWTSERGQLEVGWPELYSATFCVDAAFGGCSLGFGGDGISITNPDGAALNEFVNMVQGLRIRVLTHDYLAGSWDGAGVAYVDFRIKDEAGNVVHERRYYEAPFCAFETTNWEASTGRDEEAAQASNCPFWAIESFSDEFGGAWPDGMPVIGSQYD